MAETNQLSPYSHIYFADLDPMSEAVSQARAEVVAELSPHEEYMRPWFQQKKWQSNGFTSTTVVRDQAGCLLGISSCKLLPDRTLKILCHLYLMRGPRSRYRSLPQTDLIPRYVEQARALGVAGVWYSIHPFDRRHERLSTSIKRAMNGGRVDLKYQPYLKAFGFAGRVLYNNVWQDKFYFPL